MYIQRINEKISILIFILIVLSIPLFSSIIVNPYSYLAKPPIDTSISVNPDKAKYDRDEIIKFNVVITLDTLQTEKNRLYKVVIGNLGDLLVSSELIKSDVQSTYDMNFDKNVVKLNFTVKMLEDNTPPNIKIEIVRFANTESKAVRQYQGFQIDQYEKVIITSPNYEASKK